LREGRISRFQREIKKQKLKFLRQDRPFLAEKQKFLFSKNDLRRQRHYRPGRTGDNSGTGDNLAGRRNSGRLKLKRGDAACAKHSRKDWYKSGRFVPDRRLRAAGMGAARAGKLAINRNGRKSVFCSPLRSDIFYFWI